MAKSLRSKRVQANKRVMREKAATIDTQKHDQIAQKLHQQQQSFNMTRISTLRKNLYKKKSDDNADVDMEDKTDEIKRKVLGVKKTIEKPKRSVPGPSSTTPSLPSRGTEWLKKKDVPYRPRQYQRSNNRLPKYDPTAPKTTESTATTDAMVDADGEQPQTDAQKQYQADIVFMENFHKNQMDMRARLRDICPPAELYFLSVTDRFLEEEKKAKEFAIANYKVKGSKAVPPKPTETFTEQKKKDLLLTGNTQDKAAVLTEAESLSFYQREADGSTVIDDVKVYLPAGYGRFGFQNPENLFVHHLNDVVESLKRGADHKIRYSLFRKEHEKEFNEKVAETRARIKQYQAKNKIPKSSEEKKSKPLGLLMRERINKMRGDFMNKKAKADHSSLRNASLENVTLEKNRAASREGNKVQKTIMKLNTGKHQKYGREKNNLQAAAKHYINKEFATAMATRDIMYGKQ